MSREKRTTKIPRVADLAYWSTVIRDHLLFFKVANALGGSYRLLALIAVRDQEIDQLNQDASRKRATGVPGGRADTLAQLAGTTASPSNLIRVRLARMLG